MASWNSLREAIWFSLCSFISVSGSLFFASAPTGLDPALEQPAGLGAETAARCRLDAAGVGEGAHQCGIPTAGTKRLAVQVDMGVVVEHAALPIEDESADEPCRRRAVEPGSGLGLAQGLAECPLPGPRIG